MLPRILIFIFSPLFPLFTAAQATTGGISGGVAGEKSILLNGASIKIIHDPTGTAYYGRTIRGGNFSVSNLPPGGPYTVEVSFVNYEVQQIKNITVNLGEETDLHFVLRPQVAVLKNVTVVSGKNDGNRSGGTIINSEKMNLLPGRNLYDHLRALPQAGILQGNEGAVSFAGQNNRYNSFYVDGAVNNDVFGLAASGTNGGMTGVPILPIEAIAQYQVTLAPFDASVGNFTGAAINATTRSGTNKPENAVYHFFSNRNLSGKTPTGDKNDAVKLPAFFSRIYGLRTQGAFIKNKLFYFVNIELERELFSQPFSFEAYKGNTKNTNLVTILANTIKGNYQYDPGSFLDNPRSVNADRAVTRIDWNINRHHVFSFSGRYTFAQRMNTNSSNANLIHFSNDGYALFSGTASFSAELKSSIGEHGANKLLITYTRVKDDREPLLRPFPRVRINDGEGAFVFGTDNSSTINLLSQSNWSISEKYKFSKNKHTPAIGFEMEHSHIFNAFIQNSFGNYTYSSLDDFLTNNRPSAYQLSFPLTDNKNNDYTNASADFSVLKTALFVNDELRFNHFLLQYGLRFDEHFFLNTPATNEYVNTTALPEFAKYWNTENAVSGGKIKVPVSLSPRIGFTCHLSKHDLVLRGGAGIFSGRMPLAWPGGVYNNNGISIGGFSANAAQLNKIRFRKDPYQQWTPAELGAVINKEPLNLVSENFGMPKLWRLSLAIDKKWKRWSATTGIMFSKNINEIKYTNLNLLPPADNVSGPDNRPVYSSVNNAKIPLNADGSNPFDYVILLSNNKNKTGYAYDCSANLAGNLGRNWKFDLSYHLGQSYVNNDGTSSVNLTQWRSVETVNGRNFITRSVSDFSAGHRIFLLFSRGFGSHAKAATTLSFIYTGQSGSPVSYVYEGSLTRDDGVFGAYDLVYVPSRQDMETMLFLPNTINGITYTAAQQKEALNLFIQNDPYLEKRRGQYAERNGSRLPFTHVIDLRIRHDIRIRTKNWQYTVQLTCDLFNFTNFLNRNLGRRYDQPFDNIPIISFAGYTGPGDNIPRFRFDPRLVNAEKWPVSRSATPAYSARWNGRLGIRLAF